MVPHFCFNQKLLVISIYKLSSKAETQESETTFILFCILLFTIMLYTFALMCSAFSQLWYNGFVDFARMINIFAEHNPKISV